MNKKVLLMVNKSNAGGAQKYTFDIARSLPRESYTVAVAAGGNGTLFEQCKKQGIRTIQLPYFDRDISIIKEFKAFFSLITLLRQEKPDILHLNSPKMGGIAGLAGRIAGVKKIIYTNHGWSFHEDRPWWQKMLIAFFSWIIILLSTRTIVLSSKEYTDVMHWPFTHRKLAIIPLGIEQPDLLEKVAARKALFDRAGISDQGQEVLLSIGELTKNKGYTYALEALYDYDASYVYFIAGSGELQESLLQSIKTHGLATKVFLLGYVAQASQYIRAADVFLLPSIKEGLPYVLLEAGYGHVPTIATAVGGIPDFANEATDKLVPPKNSTALLKALENKQTVIFPTSTLDQMVKNTLELYL